MRSAGSGPARRPSSLRSFASLCGARRDSAVSAARAARATSDRAGANDCCKHESIARSRGVRGAAIGAPCWSIARGSCGRFRRTPVSGYRRVRGVPTDGMANFGEFLSARPGLQRRLFFLARRFVAGESVETAIAAVRKLNASGLSATLDFLGEDVHDEAAAAL